MGDYKMGTPLARRFYEVLSNCVYSLIMWLIALIVSVTLEAGTKAFSEHMEVSVTWFLITFPLYLIVLFGCHSLISIGYHMIVLEDCKDAQDELFREIDEAKKFLSSKGMKFD